MKYVFSLLVCLIFSLNIISQEKYKSLTDYQFDFASVFSEGLAVVDRNGKSGFIDETGKIVIDFQFDGAVTFSEGLAAVKKNRKYGFINKNGDVVIDFQYDYASGFLNGKSAIYNNGRWHLINKSGEIIFNSNIELAQTQDDPTHIIWAFDEGLITVKKNGKYGFVDRSGNVVIDYQFDKVTSFRDDITAVCIDDKWGIIDKFGDIVSKFQFQNIWSFSEGLAVIIKNDKYGFIDKSGNVIKECQFDFANSFSEGLAAVKKNGKYGFINKKGEIVIDFQYDFASSFSEGLAAVKKHNEYGYINKYGNLIINYQYNSASSFSNGLAKIKKAGSGGLIDKTGNIIIYNFDNIIISSNNILRVKKNGKYGFIKLLHREFVDLNIPNSNLRNDKTFALIIGNENYSDEISVPYAYNDAQVFSQYCIKTLGIPEKQVHLLLDGTYGQILGELNWLSNIIDVFNGEAKIIVYYAGHGMLDESSKNTFILPVDGNATIPETGISLDNIYNRLNSKPTKSVSIFLDACFSGTARNGMLLAGRGVRIQPKENIVNGNLVVFSATDGAQTALPYEDKEHGLFTYFLLKKLNESKGQVTFGELSDYLIQNVKQQSIIINQKLQTPKVNVGISMKDNWQNLKF